MISLLGIPYDKSSSFLRGAALAPPIIRQMGTDGSANDYTELGVDYTTLIEDKGDLPLADHDTPEAFEIIAERVSKLLKDGNPLISLGGDHSITYPIIEGFAKYYDNLHILHIDAHGDLYDTFEGSRFSHACPFARIMEEKLAARLTQVGIRTLTPHQREQIIRFDVDTIEMKYWRPDTLLNLKGPLYISLDLDALDPAYAPGVSHHEPGGFTTREILHLIHQIDVPIVGADIVEYNPTRDIHHQTAMLAFKLMKEIVGVMGRNGGEL